MTELMKLGVYLTGFSAYLISGNPVYLRCLFIISISESFSKIRLDVQQDKFKWKRAFRIVFGKLWYIALIIVTTQVDYMLVESGREMPISFTNMTVLGLAAYDVSRFLENLKGFGVNVPEIVLNMLKKLMEYINKGKS